MTDQGICPLRTTAHAQGRYHQGVTAASHPKHGTSFWESDWEVCDMETVQFLDEALMLTGGGPHSVYLSPGMHEWPDHNPYPLLFRGMWYWERGEKGSLGGLQGWNPFWKGRSDRKFPGGLRNSQQRGGMQWCGPLLGTPESWPLAQPVHFSVLCLSGLAQTQLTPFE